MSWVNDERNLAEIQGLRDLVVDVPLEDQKEVVRNMVKRAKRGAITHDEPDLIHLWIRVGIRLLPSDKRMPMIEELQDEYDYDVRLVEI